MAIRLGSNLSIVGKLFDFERQYFKTLKSLKAYPEENVPDGYEAYCEESETWYVFSSKNILDNKTGRWRRRIEIVDNLEETTPGKVLDARQGKILNEKILGNSGLVDGVKEFCDRIEKEVGRVSDNLTKLEGSKGKPGGLAGLNEQGQLEETQIPESLLNGLDEIKRRLSSLEKGLDDIRKLLILT